MHPFEPELNFSVSEVEESGLLSDSISADVFAPPVLPTNGPQLLRSQDRSEISNSNIPNLQHGSLSAQQPALASHCVQEKRYDSREYQKRFRERQKVLAQAAAIAIAYLDTSKSEPLAWHEVPFGLRFCKLAKYLTGT